MCASRTNRLALTLLLALGALPAGAAARQAPPPPDGHARTQVLVLGTFHFRDAGLDDYKPRFSVDVMSPERQREIEELLGRLAAFKPTKIVLEWPEATQTGLDSAYTAFLAGSRPATANERDQLGFRLAQRLGHVRVYAFDAAARWYDMAMNEDTLIARARRFGQTDLLPRALRWDAYYTRVYAFEDSLKATMTLREYLLRINSPENLRRSLGAYLVGAPEVGGNGDYTGADMRSAWYNRNIRMFANLLRLQSAGEERLLVIVGAGHAPLLRHLIENAPEMRLVAVEDWLR